MGNIQPFDHVPYPPLWNLKEVVLGVVMGLIALYLAINGCNWCRKRYSLQHQYEKLKKDGLFPEMDSEQSLDGLDPPKSMKRKALVGMQSS